ncbi:hypothetical protein VNI00_019268 [Paramarasmius palmivorus]|uniref:Uncharacterized protein n=1 Tax=Paramarasmius palmivorus TaxID=297713 RepID=A0AAW0AND5_9AGAR
MPRDLWFTFTIYVSSLFILVSGVYITFFIWPSQVKIYGLPKGMALLGLLFGLLNFFGGLASIIDMVAPRLLRFDPLIAAHRLRGIIFVPLGIYWVIVGHALAKSGLYWRAALFYVAGILFVAGGIRIIYGAVILSKLLQITVELLKHLAPRLKNSVQNPLLSQLYFPILSGAFTIVGAVLGASKYATLFNILAGVTALLAVLTSTTVVTMLGKIWLSNPSGLATPSLSPAHPDPGVTAHDSNDAGAPSVPFSAQSTSLIAPPQRVLLLNGHRNIG